MSKADSNRITACLVVLCLLPACAPAWAGLPPARQLIRQTDDACKRYEKRTGESADLPLIRLAKAQTYMGDYVGTLQTVGRISDSLWRYMALSAYLEIRFERTGTVSEIPADAFGMTDSEKDAKRQTRIAIAKFLAAAGRLPEALDVLPNDEHNIGAAWDLVAFYLFLAEDQTQRGDKRGAVASLEHAWSILCRFERLKNSVSVEWLDTIAKLWLQLGEQERALDVKNELRRLAHDWSTNKEANRYVAWAWARVGKLEALFGQDDAAHEAFREALRLANTAAQNAKDVAAQNAEEEDITRAHLRVGHEAQTLGKIGTWQFAAGQLAEAAKTYAKATVAAGRIQDDGQHDYALGKLLELQLDGGDIKGALETLEQMRRAYWKAEYQCRCAEKLAEDGKLAACRRLLEQAEALADRESEPNNSTSMFTKIAEARAKAEDLSAAKRCLEKALQVSRKTEANDHHQWIARSQVRVGLFEDAYETIMAIPEAEWRLIPLAELAHQTAKREALSQKKAAER